MSDVWAPDELRRIGDATELEIASRRADGSLRPYVTIWVARSEGDIYVRSAHGTENPWYRRATASGRGRIRYHAQYDRYGPQIVGSVVGQPAATGTLRLVPQH